MLRKSLALGAVFSCLAACSAANEPPTDPVVTPDVSESAEEVHGDTFTYYIVTRQDTRKCMYPICGGWYVKRVNRAYTQCSDGSYQLECHVADLDLSALGVSADTESNYRNGSFGTGHGLVRGHLKAVDVGNGLYADTLVASEAWVGAAESTPSGTFYKVTDNGLVCFTYPCDSITEAKLNAYTVRDIADVDLYASGAANALIDNGYSQMAAKGTLVAGYHNSFWGPAGKGKTLIASEFYLPLGQETKYCATTTLAGSSPTFYAKNFSSEKEGWNWLAATFPNGTNSSVIEGPCDQPHACITLYSPVCGTVKDYPAQTYSNSCVFQGAVMADAGSSGESKGYYTDGACGSTPTCDYSDPSKNWVSQSAEQCMAIKFACADGYAPFFNECGCGCEVAPTPKGEPCGNVTCAVGQVCCNASCSICTDPGMACTQQACL